LELIWVKCDLIEEYLMNSGVLGGVYPHFSAFGIIYGTISVLFNITVFLKILSGKLRCDGMIFGTIFSKY
jgi:hypothetical protein